LKKAFSLLVCTLLIFVFASSAFAWAPRVEGKPDAFDPGATRGYFIWHDWNGLHLWTTTRGQEHHFSGVIRTDGRFINVHGKRLESDDWYRVGPERHEMNFDFTTSGGLDGVNFEIEGGDHVNFDLFIDGHRINPEEIYIGDRGWHPDQDDFTLFR